MREILPFLYHLTVHVADVEQQQDLLSLIILYRVGVSHGATSAAMAADKPMLVATWRLAVARIERCVQCVKPGEDDFEGAYRLNLAAQVVSQLAGVLAPARGSSRLNGLEGMKTSPSTLLSAARLGHRLRLQPFAGAIPEARAITRETGCAALGAACSLVEGFDEAYGIEVMDAGLLEAMAVLSLARIGTDDIERLASFRSGPSEATVELVAALGPLAGIVGALLAFIRLATSWPRFAHVVRDHLAHVFVTILAPLVTTEEPKAPRGAIRDIVRDHWLHLGGAFDMPSIDRSAYYWSPACPRHLPDSPDGPLQRCSGCKLASCASRPLDAR